MNKLARILRNAISLFATVFLPTRKTVISISSAVNPLSSDCIEIVRIIQTADLGFSIKLVVHVDADNTEIKRTDGTIVVKKGSLKSVFYALTSRLSIVTHGLRDIGPFVNLKTVVFNVWHGAPLKKIGYHSKMTLERKRLKNISRAWDYFVVPSSAWVSLFSEAFALPVGKILPIGYPRYRLDVLSPPRKDERQLVKVTYLPTYRAGISSFEVYNFLRDPEFLRFLEVNEVELTVRLHPVDRVVEKDFLKEFLCQREVSTEEMIAQCDLLVTDCSSVIVDAAAMDIETSLYFPDFAKVEESLGGFYHGFPGEAFRCAGAEHSMDDIISEFLKNGVGNYHFPSELTPRDNFSKIFLTILPDILQKSAVTLTSSQP